jgi:hypothetical protein
MEDVLCVMALLKSANAWPADTTHTSRGSRVLRAGAEKRRRTDYTREAPAREE